MAVEVILPKIDEAMTEGKIIEWVKNEGDRVEKGTILFSLETEKVNWEVESPAAGIMSRHLAEAGDVVPVGRVVVYILQEGEMVPDIKEEAETVEAPENKVSTSTLKRGAEPKKEAEISREVGLIKASPLAKKIARENKIDLSMVEGSGPGGRVKKDDILRFMEKQSDQMPEAAMESEEGLVELTSMRKTIARRMTESFQQVPHFFLTAEADMFELISVRKSILPNIEKNTGIRVTFTDLFVRIVAKAVEGNSEINVSWADGMFRLLADINVGIAVNLDDGLVVPVIREANLKSLAQIATCRSELVERARRGKIMPQEMKGGSLTISNMGMCGIDQFCPIINPPESCILGIGSTIEKPVVKDGQVVVRPRLKLTLSIDHRVLDGGSGSRFLTRVKELIEQPLLML